MRIVLFAILTLLFTACSKNPQKEQLTPPSECIIENTKAPVWVCQPMDTKEYIVAVGSAEQNAAKDIQFQREEALASARDEIARKLSLKVKNMFKQFRQSIGSGKAQLFDKVTQSVSKQLAYQTLNGTKQLNLWISPKGTLFVLVGLPVDENFKNELKQAVKSSFQNSNAEYLQNLAKNAHNELDEAIDKEFSH